MKKYIKEIFLLLTLCILFGLELIKYKLFNINFDVLNLIKRESIIIIIYLTNLLILKKYKNVNILINIGLLIFATLSLLFTSLNSFGFLIFYLFLLLITLDFMILTKNNFEVSMVISVSILIILFVIVALLNILNLSYIILFLITLFSIVYLIKNKIKALETIKTINTKSIIIFSILFTIAILGGAGRYVHKWDEYSYWAYAAKVCINENSIYSVISRLGTTKTYPPVSTIWHYIVNIFAGYSEPNLYIGLTILTFIYMMPLFEKITNKNNFSIISFTMAIIYFPMLFNGSITYSLLYVDLLLAALCSSALVIQNKTPDDKKRNKVVILLLIIITLLKTNGFVFGCSLILLFYLKDLAKDKLSIKHIFNKVRKYILPTVLILTIYIIWRILANSVESIAYDFVLLPDSLKSDILPKLQPKFLLDFISKLISSIDETVIYSFINIPLFTYLIIVLCGIYRVDKNKNLFKTLLPYIITYVTFFLLTALSLFVMFSKYEASNLASFGRYLAPINIALTLYILYRLSTKKEEKILNSICILIICLAGFSNTTFFLTDIAARRETVNIRESRIGTFKEVTENTEKDDKIFIINQADSDTIMPLWYARYYCYPRVVNSSSNAITWKIKTESNSWDLQDWGLTAEEFEKHVIAEGFNYVYIYSSTEELYDELKDVFEETNDLSKTRLFKIRKVNNNNIKLIAVESE